MPSCIVLLDKIVDERDQFEWQFRDLVIICYKFKVFGGKKRGLVIGDVLFWKSFGWRGIEES